MACHDDEAVLRYKAYRARVDDLPFLAHLCGVLVFGRKMMRRLLVNIVSYICSLRKWLEWKRRTHKLVAGEVHFWPMREQGGSGGSSSGEGGRRPKTWR